MYHFNAISIVIINLLKVVNNQQTKDKVLYSSLVVKINLHDLHAGGTKGIWGGPKESEESL